MLLINSSFKVLDLSWNLDLADDITDESTPGSLLAQVINGNTTLEKLVICSCSLTVADYALVFESMAQNNATRLTTLYIDMDEALMMALARRLPDISRLKELRFKWPVGVSIALMQDFVLGLYENTSLLCVGTRNSNLQDGQLHLWKTWSKFVTSRNMMIPIVMGNLDVPAAQRQRQVLAGFWPHLLGWCNADRRTPEVQASLVYYILSQRKPEELIGECKPQAKSYLSKR